MNTLFTKQAYTVQPGRKIDYDKALKQLMQMRDPEDIEKKSSLQKEAIAGSLVKYLGGKGLGALTKLMTSEHRDALIGGGVGAVGGSILGYLKSRKEEEENPDENSVLGDTVLGAGLGGLTGAGAVTALKHLKGKNLFSSDGRNSAEYDEESE